MADNYSTTLGAGDGPTFASDEIGAAQVPRIKVQGGRDGIAADVATLHYLRSANTTNPTVVKAGAGTIYSLVCFNLNAAVRYLKLYNRSSTPSPETGGTPITIPIPANVNGAGFSVPIPFGWDFSTGISYRLTTGVGDSDANAVAANEVFVLMGYA